MRPDESRPPYSQFSQRLAFFEQVQERLRHVSGIQCTAVAGQSPVFRGGNVPRFQIEGFSPSEYNAADQQRFPGILMRLVSPDYFRVLEVPLLKGRHFTDQDRTGTSLVAIVSDSMARRYWPGENPVGRYITRIRQTRAEQGQEQETRFLYRVIGVAGNAKTFNDPKVGPPEPVVYVSYAQFEWSGYMCLLLRTDFHPERLAEATRSAVLAVEGNARIRSMAPLASEIAQHIAPQRFNMLSLGGVATAALGLAAIGVYGITAYAVSHRTREISLRMALGANRSDVLKAILRHGLKLTSIGLILGLAGVLAATRIIRSLLYDVSPTDPLTARSRQ